MGILDFLRRFSAKKEEEIEEIELEQLGRWIDDWSKKALEKANTELNHLRQNLAEEKKKTAENNKGLEQAKLRNPNIPERVRRIMEGSRTAYIQKVTLFLGELDLPEQLEDILEFCDVFDKNLDQLGKSTIRNYQILQEFFGNEARAISANIKHIHDIIVKVKKTAQDAGIQKVDEVKNEVQHVQQKIKQKQEIKEQLKQAEQELQKEKKEIEDKEKKIKELEEGSAYKKFSNLTDEKQTVQKEIQEMEKHESFSVIEAALKKYERLTLEDKLVRGYLDNSVKALLQDKELKIVELLAKMKESIKNGELELKAKKKDKILRELDKLDRSYFEGYVNRHKELNKKLKVIETEIGTIAVVNEIEELKQGLIQNRAEQKQTKINDMMKALEEINIEHLKKNLEKEVRENISEAVRIK